MKKDFVAKARFLHRLSDQNRLWPKVQTMQNMMDVVFLFVFVGTRNGDDRRQREGINDIEFLLEAGEIMLGSQIER